MINYYTSSNTVLSYSSLHLFGVFYVLFLIRFFYRVEGLDVFSAHIENVLALVLSFFSFIMLPVILDLLFRNKKMIIVLKALVVAVSYYLGVYFLRNQSELDYSVMIGNIDLLFYDESLSVIGNHLSFIRTKDHLLGLLLVCILIFFEYRSLRQFNLGIKRRVSVGMLLLGSYLIIAAQLNYSYDFISSFLNKIYIHHLDPKRHAHTFDDNSSFELKTMMSTNHITHRPNILLVMIESFNSNFALAKNKDEKEYTPHFNALTSEGMYIENFYGNSMQTAKGQFATLCSLFPHSKHKVSTHYANNNFRCLPKILNEFGYTTTFLNGYHSLAFDNTEGFLRGLGFKYLYATPDLLEKKIVSKYTWGW